MLKHERTQVDKSVLLEFRKALEIGDTKPILDRHSDEILLQLLKNRKDPMRPVLFLVGLLVASILVVASILGVFHPIADDSESRRKASRAWKPIAERIEKASLTILLEASTLNIPELSSAVQSGMIKQLNLATAEELQHLSYKQRQQLVRFTLRQLRPQWVGYPVLDAPQRQSATLGYLALATLKQPRAERPNRSGMNATHIHLKKAIEEYHATMQSS